MQCPALWLRRREARRISAIVLGIAYAALMVGLVGGGIMLLGKQIKAGAIPVRPAGKGGDALAVIMVLVELNALSSLDNFYPTATPLTLFRISEAVGLVIVPLVMGLAGWLLTGLAISLYPVGWRIFSGSARRVWRRDAA